MRPGEVKGPGRLDMAHQWESCGEDQMPSLPVVELPIKEQRLASVHV